MFLPKITAKSLKVITALIAIAFLTIDIYIGCQLFKSLKTPKQTVSMPAKEVVEYEETISMPRLPQSENKIENTTTKTSTPQIIKKEEVKPPPIIPVENKESYNLPVQNNQTQNQPIVFTPPATMVQNNQLTINTTETPAPPVIQAPIIIQQNNHMEKLQIISPMSNKGLGREYVASESVQNEYNYIEIGLVVYDSAGEPDRNTEVIVEVTDQTQNKTMSSTGTVGRIYENGVKKEVFYYPFTYEFKTAGEHTITFKANGMTESVTVTAK